mmetsp:Transcript_36525/g.56697  ORF Transcript_36525/g.56697 Transcript_36525/m.56697 type:complete len:97 (+) Transcript_36525:51-341(+)
MAREKSTNRGLAGCTPHILTSKTTLDESHWLDWFVSASTLENAIFLLGFPLDRGFYQSIPQLEPAPNMVVGGLPRALPPPPTLLRRCRNLAKPCDR